MADVDGDGCDEIVYGSCVINNDGTVLYSTGLGHGDAMHIANLDPDRPGYQVWEVHEEKRLGKHTVMKCMTHEPERFFGEVLQKETTDVD